MNDDRIAELLAPAGDEDALTAALRYGADAVYLGGKSFGMRARAANFGPDALVGAVKTAHSHGAKIYLTCNTLPRGRDLDELPTFIDFAAAAGIDALIVADLGVLALSKRLQPGLACHISTQFGVVNHLAAAELYNLGAERVILARELTLGEIAEIRAKTPPQLSLEAFVHGAVCLSVSGRCVISNYLTGRDANNGECAQPCRWKYALMESERPGQYFPAYEEDSYSYLLNANDLCMIGHLDKLAAAGVDTFKIEGRAKSAYYVAVVTGAYRKAIDHLAQNGGKAPLPDWLLEEVEKISHRPYSTGFYLPDSLPDQDRVRGGYNRFWQLVATVDGYAGGYIHCTERNRFSKGEELEALAPDGPPITLVVDEMLNEDGERIETARHPMMKVKIRSAQVLPAGAMLRRREPGQDSAQK
ncbi:MAG: U32 family peptidase [Oscillospiraceae bacterium]|nr:U32 family peptidase [Oscillospiraceae bacterium]